MDDFDLDSLDLNDLLADVEQELDDLTHESPWDRHDRLRITHMDAQDALDAAEAALTQALDGPASRLGWSRYNGDRWTALVAVWPDYVDGYRLGRVAIDTMRKRGDGPTWVEGVTPEEAERILALHARVLRAVKERDEAHAAWQAARADIEILSMPEGSYVSFETVTSRTQWGDVSNYEAGFGVVSKWTADTLIVTIAPESSWYYSERKTARIKIKNMQQPLRMGGRNLKFLWGPTGNEFRKARAEAERIRKEKAAVAEAEARSKCYAATQAYDAAKAEDEDRARAVQAIPSQARMMAESILLAKYAEEFARLVAVSEQQITEALPEYERPAILDNPPSRNYRDYLPEDEEA